MNLDSRPDAQMLEGACVNYSRAVDADIIVNKQGLMVEESVIHPDSGEVIILKIKAHPAIAVSNNAWRQLRAFCSEFGLSPVSRTRLTLEKPDSSASDLADILFGGDAESDPASAVN
jgi:P27 family predicted phage terminase small subunit